MGTAPFHPPISARGNRRTPTPSASACSHHTASTARAHRQTQPAAAGLWRARPRRRLRLPSLRPPAPQPPPPRAAGPRGSCWVLGGPKRPQALAAVPGGGRSGSGRLPRAPRSPLAWPRTPPWCSGERESHCLLQPIASSSSAALCFPGILSSAWLPPTWGPCR